MYTRPGWLLLFQGALKAAAHRTPVAFLHLYNKINPGAHRCRGTKELSHGNYWTDVARHCNQRRDMLQALITLTARLH